jgi:sentrin-specific protease 1
MSLLSDIGHDDEEDEEEEGGEEMAELTEQQLQQVHRVLSRGSGLEVLSQKFNISIKRDDVMTLAGLNWLNDEVINFYMNLIMERGKKEGSVCRVHVMSSFFYPKLCDVGYSGVQRWTKKVDVFSVDLVLYPIHLGTHWCLAAIDNRQRSLAYYDSLGGRGKSCLATLRDYLVSEYRDKKKAELSLNGWSDVPVNNIPLQKNGSDCGVFTCMYARYLSSNSPFTFSQEDMPQIRRHIICELLEQRLF